MNKRTRYLKPPSSLFLLPPHLRAYVHFDRYLLDLQRPSLSLCPHQNGRHLLPPLPSPLHPALVEEGLERLVLRSLQIDLPNTNPSVPALFLLLLPLLLLLLSLLLLLLMLLVLPLAGGLRGFPCRNKLWKEDETAWCRIAFPKAGDDQTLRFSFLLPSLPPSLLPFLGTYQ